jgi:hypothetical protein
MRVKFKNMDIFDDNQVKTIKKFIKYLQTELALNKDITIDFVNERNGGMTTGVRRKNGDISILSGNRLLIDILRTVSHEWVHEYQFQKLGVDQNKKIQDIGGPEENMANVLSGIFMKKFQKLYPNLEPVIYNE